MKTYPISSSKKTLTTHSITDTSGMPDFSQFIKPDWNKADSYTRLNNPVMELPLADTSNLLTAVRNNLSSAWGNFKNSKTSFLIINNNGLYKAYIMIIIADTSYLKDDVAKLANNSYAKHDANFSGTVTYFTPKGKIVNGWVYKNGKVTGKITQGQPASASKSINSLDKRLLYDDNGCTYYYYEYYFTIGDTEYVIGTDFAYSTGCDEQSLAPDNPDDGGMTPPGDGGGGSSIFIPIVDTTKSPCKERLTLSTLAAAISANRATITNSSTTIEFGAVIALRSLTGTSNYENSPVTPGTSSDWTPPPFTWNSIDGFQLGSLHSHPDGSPPDPDDLFTLIINYSQSADLLGASTADQNFIKPMLLLWLPTQVVIIW